MQPTPDQTQQTDEIYTYFQKLAGDDLEVDWCELKEILDYSLKKGSLYLFY